jgi:hypothetical protein
MKKSPRPEGALLPIRVEPRARSEHRRVERVLTRAGVRIEEMQRAFLTVFAAAFLAATASAQQPPPQSMPVSSLENDK